MYAQGPALLVGRAPGDRHKHSLMKGLQHKALKRNIEGNCTTLNIVIYIFENEKDHCVLTISLIVLWWNVDTVFELCIL